MFVFLCGYMSVGKSTVGKKLANKMNYSFIDLDEYISKKELLSIPEIFEKRGEAYFRELETKYLKECILENTDVVISLGGGTPCFFDNMELINNAGVSVYLHAQLDTILNRLKNAKNNRPIIKNLDDVDLKLFVGQQLKQREVYYQKAHIAFPAENLDSKKLEELLKLISNYCK
jgi:shikimate kinase